MRFSCRALLRITDRQGRYLLVLDKELRQRYGETPEGTLLVPPGGYVNGTPQGIERLQRLYGAFDFENVPELRFYAERTRFEAIRGWFIDRWGHDRETDIRRIATDLFWTDPFYGRHLSGMAFQSFRNMFLGASTVIGETTRPYVAESHTVWLIETFTVWLHGWDMTHALEIAEGIHQEPFHFATQHEIEQGQTYLGYPIDQRLAQYLLRQDRPAGS